MKLFNLFLAALFLASPAIALARSCEEMVGQMITTDPPPPPDKNIGGVILYDKYLDDKGGKSQAGVRALVNDLKQTDGGGTPRFVSFDQEGGTVQRLDKERGFKALPSAKAIGQMNDTSRAGYWGGMAGKQLAGVGASMNYSTVADICNEGNPVINAIDRCYSDNPEVVAKNALENLLGNSYFDVVPTIKHFPGHGATRADSHKDFASVDKSLDELWSEDVAPFAYALSEFTQRDKSQQNEWRKKMNLPAKPQVDRYPSVMVGHLTFPQIPGAESIPASLNRDIVTGWLRGKLNHKGLIVTDDIGGMAAIRKKYTVLEATKMAIKAGNDMVIIKNDGNPKPFNSTEDQAKFIANICADSDPLLKSEIADSYLRILKNKKDYGVLSDQNMNEELNFLPQSDLEKSVQDLRASIAGPADETQDGIEQ